MRAEMITKETSGRQETSQQETPRAALVPSLATAHLTLGAVTLLAFLCSGFYMLVRDPPTRGQRSVQWIGSTFLALASVLLIMAFLTTALHFGTGLRGRRTTG